MSFEWTEENLSRAKALLAEGVSIAKIAHDIQASSRDIVEGKLRRLGLLPLKPRPPTPWTPEALETLRTMLAAGHSDGQIAKALGTVSGKSVGKKIKRMKLPRAWARQPAERQAPPKGPAEPFVPTRIPLERTTFMQCRFPLWDNTESGRPDFIVCGNRTELAEPYCEHHAKICQPQYRRASPDDRAKSREAARITGSTRMFG